MTIVELLCRGLFVLVFATAVVGKLHSAAAFARYRESVVALTPRKHLDGVTATALAACVVAAETAVVALLLVSVTRRAGYLLAACLLTAFAVAVLGATRRGRSVRCRCFGSAGAVLGRRHVRRNALLALAALTAAAAAGDSTSAPVTLVALTGGVLLGLAVTHEDDLAFLFATAATSGGRR